MPAYPGAAGEDGDGNDERNELAVAVSCLISLGSLRNGEQGALRTGLLKSWQWLCPSVVGGQMSVAAFELKSVVVVVVVVAASQQRGSVNADKICSSILGSVCSGRCEELS